MNKFLKKIENIKSEKILLSGSKSETNRMLLLQALFPNITLDNISNSDDSVVMGKALDKNINHIDIHHAGTAMRFLTAFFALQEGREVVLTGSIRMQERPIEILVNALKSLGADIEYLNNQGFPPLKIKGKKLLNPKISIQANVSSQYLSALLLIAPQLENGLELTLEGKITSFPYLNMTLELLKNIGVILKFQENVLTILPKKSIEDYHHIIESDWSSASYFYSFVALSKIGTSISISSLKQNSLQADAVISKIYEKLGVVTTFKNTTIEISKVKSHEISHLEYDFSDAPDIAQTVAVTCFGLGISCHFTGLHTLKIKETDRLVALQNELTKLGAEIEIDTVSLSIKASNFIVDNQVIKTYQDHRIAMAFTPLVLKTNLYIENPEVVTKSYPNFWEDVQLVMG